MQSGAALNALVYDLTDPDIDSQKWKSVSPVPLPKGTSVKELIFSFTPHRSSSLSSACSAGADCAVAAGNQGQVADAAEEG